MVSVLLNTLLNKLEGMKQFPLVLTYVRKILFRRRQRKYDFANETVLADIQKQTHYILCILGQYEVQPFHRASNSN